MILNGITEQQSQQQRDKENKWSCSAAGRGEGLGWLPPALLLLWAPGPQDPPNPFGNLPGEGGMSLERVEQALLDPLSQPVKLGSAFQHRPGTGSTVLDIQMWHLPVPTDLEFFTQDRETEARHP